MSVLADIGTQLFCAKLTGEAIQGQSEKCLEPVYTAGHHPKYRAVGCASKGTMRWGQSAKDRKRGAFE